MILPGLSQVREYLENQEKSGNFTNFLIKNVKEKSANFTNFLIKNVKEKCPVIDTWM